MITLNSEKGLVQVDGWEDIESRPGFVRDLDPTTHKLKAIIGRYVFAEKIRCGLSNCHTPHSKGYIAATEDGHETNIGKDCGKTYFGVDFELLSRQFDRDLTAFQNREALATFSFHLEEIENRIRDLRQAQRGADWVHRNTRPLLAANRGCPDEVVRKLSEMVRTRASQITVDRPGTEKEIEAIEAQENRKLKRPHYITDVVGQIDGLSALYPENDLRELLVLDLQENIAKFREVVITELTHAELRRWTKWTASVDNTLDRANEIVATGRTLMTADNLQKLVEVISDQASRVRFRKLIGALLTP